MHERSETVQLPSGEWVNVYGRGLPKAGQQLPDTPNYTDLESALEAARAKSALEGQREMARQLRRRK